jgi:hypothetical protein
MERQRFYFLYVNLNSLAELALRQLAAKILAQPLAGGVPETLSEAERDALVMANFQNLDFAALDGLDFSSTQPVDIEEFESELSVPSMSEPAVSEQSAEDGEEPDVERYLARAYGYEELLRDRIDHCYRSADLSAMDAALLQLPSRLRPLTGRLSAADMTDWLTLYAEGNEVLTDITAQMRRLDISAGKM